MFLCRCFNQKRDSLFCFTKNKQIFVNTENLFFVSLLNVRMNKNIKKRRIEKPQVGENGPYSHFSFATTYLKKKSWKVEQKKDP